MTRPARVALAGLLGAALTATVFRAFRAMPADLRSPWDRTNHAGRRVTLLEGPAYAVGAAGAAALAGSAPVVAVLGGAGFGVLDDLAGDSSSKGLKGHLRALARGELTTGAVKIVGLVATGAASALLSAGHPSDGGAHPRLNPLLDGLIRTGLVAGSANLANLFDLRPGRALKMTTLVGVPLAFGSTAHGALPAAVAAGSALGVLGPDLRGESMLGDTGANAAGALLGVALSDSLGRRGRVVALAVIVGLTLASERISFTRVIESTPGLRELDAWGRIAPAGRSE